MIFILILFSFFLITNAQRIANISSCRVTDVIVGRDGRVVKNICELPVGYSHADSVTACANNGMDLFVAEDEFIYSSYMTFFQKRYGSHGCGVNWSNDCGIIINGEKDPIDGNFYAVMNNKKKLMDVSFYNFVSNSESNFYDPGFCLVVKRQNSSFGVTSMNCERKHAPTCEYNNIYKRPCGVKNQGKRYYNLASCSSIGTIRDGCGNVVKGVCGIYESVTYDEGIKKCRNQGMDLFTAETKDVYDSFIQFINEILKDICGSNWSRGCGVWIGGKQNNEVWETVKDFTNVSMNIEHYKLISSDEPGLCMALKNANGFAQMAYTCEQKYGIICEFDNKI